MAFCNWVFCQVGTPSRRLFWVVNRGSVELVARKAADLAIRGSADWGLLIVLCWDGGLLAADLGREDAALLGRDR
eukprot:scaffold55446_cov33-Tisochrysis_lutea.AAC.1